MPLAVLRCPSAADSPITKGDVSMESNRPRENALLTGIIWKQLLLFFLPVALGTFFQQMYNTVDALVVGNFVGMNALGAVGGATASVINLILGFFVGVSSGAAVIIAQQYGAGNREVLSRVVHTTAALSLAAGVFLTAAGVLFVPGTLTLLHQPQALMTDSVTYLRIYFAGILPTLLYNVGAGVLRAVGDSRRPMIYLIVCCAVNVALDLLLVAALPLGVAGAAIATVLSQVVSAVLVIVRLLRTEDAYRLIPRLIRFHRRETGLILRIGLPAGLQSMMYSIANTFIQSRINLYGTVTVAAWTVLGKMDGLSWLIIGAFGISVTTFVGQNYGAGRIRRVRRSIWVAHGMALCFTVLFSVAILILGRPLYLLFGADEDPAVLTAGMRMLWLIAPFYSLYVPVEIFSGAMRGVGKTLVPTLITCVGVCLLRIVWTTVAYNASPSFDAVVLSYPVSWLCASAAFFLYHRFGHWLPKADLQVQA